MTEEDLNKIMNTSKDTADNIGRHAVMMSAAIWTVFYILQIVYPLNNVVLFVSAVSLAVANMGVVAFISTRAMKLAADYYGAAIDLAIKTFEDRTSKKEIK